MRSILVLAIAAVFATTSFACIDAADQGSSTARRSPRKNVPRVDDDAMDEDEEHDEDDTPGATSVDPGNPNASSRPAPPATKGTEAAEFGITLSDDTPTVDLGASTTIDVTIEPKGGFNGPVELSVSGLPSGVTAAPVTANVAGPTTAKLTLEASYNTPVTPPNQSVPLVVTAKSGAVQATANANFKVAPRVTITIPVNVDALRGASQLRSEYGEAFGPNGQPLLTQQGNGIEVLIFNADSKPHIIHGPGGQFPHGNTAAPIQPNSFEMSNGSPRKRTLNVGANVTAYLHDGNNGQGASFRIRVAAAP